MRFAHILGAAAALLAVLAVVGRAEAAGDKITIMVGGLDKQIYLPAKLTDVLGFYKEEGIDVETLTEPAGVQAEVAMLAGEVQATVGFYDHNIDLQSKGKQTISVVQLLQAPGEVELVGTKASATLKSAADFKGKKLGVTGLGSSTYFLTQFLAVKNGVSAKDFTPIAVGAGDTFIAAMKQGAIDAGMTTEPTVTRMVKTGDAKVLIDMRDPAKTKEALGGPYPASCLYMLGSWANAHQEQVQKLVNAYVKTMKWIAGHSAAEITDKMPRDYYAGDKDGYIQALGDSKAMFTADGLMPAGGPEQVLKVMQAFSPSVMGKTIDLSKTYTNKYVEAALKK